MHIPLPKTLLGRLYIARQLLRRLYDHFCDLDRQIKALEQQIQAWYRDSEASQRLKHIPGVGRESTPWTWKTFFARSIPMVVTLTVDAPVKS